MQDLKLLLDDIRMTWDEIVSFYYEDLLPAIKEFFGKGR